MPVLDFDTGTPHPRVPFKIRGTTSAGEAWVEEFHARTDVPATTMWKLERDASAAQRGEIDSSQDLIMPFFATVLDDDDYARLVNLIEIRGVPLPHVLAIMQGVAEAVGDRPTVPSSPSWAGRGSTPTTSVAASPSPVLPPPASVTSP
jgi:hypothetical protein